jgi:DNA-binding XRE family transcriptional regulator
MAALVHAKGKKSTKRWYVWGADGNAKWEKPYPQVQSRSEFYRLLASELGLPAEASSTEIRLALRHKTWNGTEWVDDFRICLRRLRERASYTQAQLADKAGLSPQAIAALEQGTRGPTWDTVRKLADALNVGVEEFKVELPVDDGDDAA